MFSSVVAPIVSLLNSLMAPLLAIVGALGALYCVVLGVKYAKAEEPSLEDAYLYLISAKEGKQAGKTVPREIPADGNASSHMRKNKITADKKEIPK